MFFHLFPETSAGSSSRIQLLWVANEGSWWWWRQRWMHQTGISCLRSSISSIITLSSPLLLVFFSFFFLFLGFGFGDADRGFFWDWNQRWVWASERWVLARWKMGNNWFLLSWCCFEWSGKSLDEELGLRDFEKFWGFCKHWVDWVLETL